MPHSFGYRARTRHLFARKFRQHGPIKLSTYLRPFHTGDIVDIKANAAQQKGMPHKYYHGCVQDIVDGCDRASFGSSMSVHQFTVALVSSTTLPRRLSVSSCTRSSATATWRSVSTSALSTSSTPSAVMVSGLGAEHNVEHAIDAIYRCRLLEPRQVQRRRQEGGQGAWRAHCLEALARRSPGVAHRLDFRQRSLDPCPDRLREFPVWNWVCRASLTIRLFFRTPTSKRYLCGRQGAPSYYVACSSRHCFGQRSPPLLYFSLLSTVPFSAFRFGAR